MAVSAGSDEDDRPLYSIVKPGPQAGECAIAHRQPFRGGGGHVRLLGPAGCEASCVPGSEHLSAVLNDPLQPTLSHRRGLLAEC
jgi:hypothetical protein